MAFGRTGKHTGRHSQFKGFGGPLLTQSEDSNPAELIPIAAPVSPARHIVQQITASWPNRQETLLCVLELDKQYIAIAGLSNDGISLFNLSYDGKALTLDKSPLLPDTFAPELIISNYSPPPLKKGD